MTIYFPWCISTKKYAPEILRSFAEVLIRTVDRIAKLDLLAYTMISDIPDVLVSIRTGGRLYDPKAVYTDGGSYINIDTGEWGSDILTVYRHEPLQEYYNT